MKYNYSTAILFLGRAESPTRKKFYLGATAALCVVAAGFYAMHLYRLTHPRLVDAASHAAPVATVTTAVPVATTLNQPVVKKIPLTLPVKDLTPAPVTAPTIAPVTAPVAAPVAAKTVAPVVVPSLIIGGEKVRSSPAQSAVEKSPAQKPVVLIEADELSQAAQLAFGNMMDFASQYPDIYGFKPG
ncbi:MAG TPA: hypothetical protein VIK53_07030, partial [Verrucomicrobiae bacterium]